MPLYSSCILLLTVSLVGAGEAELCITVIDPSGQTIPFDVEPTPNGQRVTYIPECPGTYKVNATYGGINVPGNFYIVFHYMILTLVLMKFLLMLTLQVVAVTFFNENCQVMQSRRTT